MNTTSSLDRNRDLILEEERRFAHHVSQRVIDKPRLGVWMILIPVFFVFYFWQLKRYADGRKTFAEKFMITRQRAVEEAHRSVSAGREANVDPLVQADDVPPQTRPIYRRWVILLVDHYRELIQAPGGDYPALVRAVYRTRTNFLLFLNRLNQAERDFDNALEPLLEPTTENVSGIIRLMEESAAELRRHRAEAIFP